MLTKIYTHNNFMGNNSAKIVTQSSQSGRNTRIKQIQNLSFYIATLKVGQSYSPLEFYPNITDEVLSEEAGFDKKLNEVFINICAKYDTEYIRFKKNQQTKLKYLNKITKNRFTPLFRSQIENEVAGIKDNVFLMTQKQFEEKWDKSFAEVLKKAKEEQRKKIHMHQKQSRHFVDSNPEATISIFNKTSQLNNSYSLLIETEEEYFEQKYQRKLKLLDLMSYHSLLAYVYNDEKSSIDKIANSHYNFQYKCFMDSLYASERNSLAKRIKSIVAYIKKQDISILFLQEISEEGINLLVKMTDQYRVSRTHFKKTGNHSVILIRKNVFDQLEQKKTHWTLGALNARYLDNFQETQQNQIPSPMKRKDPHAGLDLINKISISSHFKTIGKMLEGANSQRKPDENSSTKIYLNEEELQIQNIQNKNLKEEFQMIENAQRYSRVKKLQPISRLGILPSKQETPMVGINNSLKQKKLPKQEVRKKIGSDFLNRLKFPQNTVIQFIGNLILISVQIQQKNITINQQNIEDVLKMVEKMREVYPDHTIVMGLDIDSDLELDRSIKIYNTVETLVNKDFHSVPNLPVLHKNENPSKGMVLNYFRAANTFTINYTKTNFQFDRKNVEQKVIGCNNFIISTQKIISSAIETAKGGKVDFQHNLPNKDHPFINYFVKGKIFYQHISYKDEN